MAVQEGDFTANIEIAIKEVTHVLRIPIQNPFVTAPAKDFTAGSIVTL